MGWLEKAAAAVGRGLWRIAIALLALGVVIGVWVYLGSNQNQFNRVVDAGGDFASTAAITTFDWGTEKMGGSASSGQAATVGPKTIWVEKQASAANWPVGKAAAEWNRGLTSVTLKVGKCPSGAKCIKVSQDEVYTPEGDSLVLARTSTLFGKRVKLNAKAYAQVRAGRLPASYLQFASCHELGHALGLNGDELGGDDGHSTSKSSCMYPSAKGAATRPSRADFAAVNAEYGR